MREFSNTPYTLAHLDGKPVLYIARHGSTGGDNNYNGPQDPKLNEQGKKEAGEIADFMADKPISKIVVSRFYRASETADIIGRKLGLKPIIDDRIDSLNLGDVEHADKQEADRIVKHHLANPDKHFPGGGDSIQDFRDRVDPSLLQGIASFYTTGKPAFFQAHHSVLHEVGRLFNGDQDSALTQPGGVVAVYREPNGFRAVPIFKPE